MFQTGDQVIYGVHGVCTITGVENRAVGRKQIPYFVLEPRDQSGAKYYVPMGNPVALSKMRYVISREGLDSLMQSEEVQQDAWIQDENQRKQYYRDLITRGDRASLVRMVRTLHQHKKAQTAAGRKIHLCDENFLRDAEKLLGSEFSLVLGMSQEEVGSYVRSMLKDE